MFFPWISIMLFFGLIICFIGLIFCFLDRYIYIYIFLGIDNIFHWIDILIFGIGIYCLGD